MDREPVRAGMLLALGGIMTSWEYGVLACHQFRAPFAVLLTRTGLAI